MTTEDRMKAYRDRLSGIEKNRKESHDRLLEKLNGYYDQSNFKYGADPSNPQYLNEALNESFSIQSPLVLGQVNLSSDNRLYELDEAFIRIFNLNEFFPRDSLLYRTIYCETLDEFFTPFVDVLNLSRGTKQQILKDLCTDAENMSQAGGTYGVNLPGIGCYLNGWLFAKRAGITPSQALQNPEILTSIMKTAVHEKLGHGFLDLYSELGKVEASLGAMNLKIAEQFNIQTAADPINKIRQSQYNILIRNSIFQQEGWATWLESFYDIHVFKRGPHPRHSFKRLIESIKTIPTESAEENSVVESLLASLEIVLGNGQENPQTILSAINFLHKLDQSFEDYFSSHLQQPLRYVLGELLMLKIELNLGARCVPYAALIAGNITLDPEKISLTDMRELFSYDPFLNPDARLVMLSTLKTENKNEVRELSRMAENYWSMQIPNQLK